MKSFLASDLVGLGTIIEESVKSNVSQNDIDSLLKLFLLLYADDTIIFSETSDGLQKGLNKVKSNFLASGRWSHKCFRKIINVRS